MIDMQKIAPVDPACTYRLMNIGATVLVGTQFEGKEDVMAAAWACALDYDKVSVVIDKTHYTRPLIENGRYFAIQIPTVSIADKVMNLGWVSKNDNPDKIEESGIETFRLGGYDLPMVAGCAAWIVCERIPEPHNEATYDLFMGRVVAAWSNTDVFANNHWIFENADDSLRTLHYVAGGHFYAIGKVHDVAGYEE